MRRGDRPAPDIEDGPPADPVADAGGGGGGIFGRGVGAGGIGFEIERDEKIGAGATAARKLSACAAPSEASRKW
ncbi:MAG TPA: hypothetical protein VM755_17800 [Stellaceae bacterium]|nr:hypothetical protein [Stellaceae bacterium]